MPFISLPRLLPLIFSVLPLPSNSYTWLSAFIIIFPSFNSFQISSRFSLLRFTSTSFCTSPLPPSNPTVCPSSLQQLFILNYTYLSPSSLLSTLFNLLFFSLLFIFPPPPFILLPRLLQFLLYDLPTSFISSSLVTRIYLHFSFLIFLMSRSSFFIIFLPPSSFLSFVILVYRHFPFLLLQINQP